jgi:hypothetical protein
LAAGRGENLNFSPGIYVFENLNLLLKKFCQPARRYILSSFNLFFVLKNWQLKVLPVSSQKGILSEKFFLN